jgi:hypothetical protein
MTSFSTLSLYALTVKPPSESQNAVSGDFIGNGQTHTLTPNGSRLTLYGVSVVNFTVYQRIRMRASSPWCCTYLVI